MNTQEKIISALLALTLVGWLFYSQQQAVKQAQLQAGKTPSVSTQADTKPATPAVPDASAPPAAASPALSVPAIAHADALPTPSTPEELCELADDEVAITVSSHGATLKQVRLSKFNERPGKAGANNPAVLLDFAAAPALALSGFPELAPNTAYQLSKAPDGKVITLTTVTPGNLAVTRRIELLKNYQVKLSDTLKNLSPNVVTVGTNAIALGVMRKESTSQNEILSADSLPVGIKQKTRYWGSEQATKTYLVGGSATGFGCGGAPSATGLPEKTSIPIMESQVWVALKSRFFVTALSASEPNAGFVLTAQRDMAKQTYSLNAVSAQMLFPGRVLGQGEALTREYTLFIGPKRLSLLSSMGNQLDTVMEFGFFSWFCKLLVPTLNFFHQLIPNYGIAIILLTFLVRIIFWPLTHKSTMSMKKMQEIQPKLKEIQAKFKDNPTKLQQETWAIYRENKVNPMSSCLPMLIQIPVFIALFTVLRSAVELRYAPFLWIADLSEPENLLAGMIPVVGSLNILPFLMAATMGLQSYLTPSAGDPQQQKMMMIMMPIMMLFMFYSFPAALSLYWTISQVLSIVQMLMMRHKVTHPHSPDTVLPPEQMTRQQRRAAAR